MAEKEANIFIIDVGSSTAECNSGRTISDLDYAKEYLFGKVGIALAANRKTINLGVLAVRSDETKNALDGDEGYENIAVLKDLGPIELNHLQDLQKTITPSATEFGDAISAIVVAVQNIKEFTTLKTGKPGKYKRLVVLVTDGQGPMDDNDLDSIAEQINNLDIELRVVGTDFDDLEFGFKEEDKPEQKRRNEITLADLVKKCNNAMLGTTALAIKGLSEPDVKVTRPYASYEGRLSLGDYNIHPETALYIDVKRYFKTKLAKPVGASSFVASAGEIGDTEMADAPAISAVKNSPNYWVMDPNAPGGRLDLTREELGRGYHYGQTVVPINDSEQNVTKLETTQSFDILGFIHADKYERYLNMGPSNITIAQPVNEKAKIALSSLVWALNELQSYAVARLVTKNDKEPQLVVMAPYIDDDIDALIDVPLPFNEDFRMYRFPPLDRVITTSGATMTKHRNLPDEQLVKTMSDYVDSMDLSEFGKDEDGNSEEYMPIDDTFSPGVHRINEAIRLRAVDPEKPIQPPAEILLKFSTPPEELVTKAAPKLQKLVAAANVKEVERKAKGKRTRDPITPLSGLDVTSLLNTSHSSSSTPRKITLENSVPDFKQLLETTTSNAQIIDLVSQMGDVIFKLLKRFPNDINRVLENMRVLRTEMTELEMPDAYNEFVRGFKGRLVRGEIFESEFAVEKKEVWWAVRKNKLGLIDKEGSEHSSVTREEAQQFYQLSTESPDRSKE